MADSSQPTMRSSEKVEKKEPAGRVQMSHWMALIALSTFASIVLVPRAKDVTSAELPESKHGTWLEFDPVADRWEEAAGDTTLEVSVGESTERSAELAEKEMALAREHAATRSNHIIRGAEVALSKNTKSTHENDDDEKHTLATESKKGGKNGATQRGEDNVALLEEDEEEGDVVETHEDDHPEDAAETGNDLGDMEEEDVRDIHEEVPAEELEDVSAAHGEHHEHSEHKSNSTHTKGDKAPHHKGSGHKGQSGKSGEEHHDGDKKTKHDHEHEHEGGEHGGVHKLWGAYHEEEDKKDAMAISKQTHGAQFDPKKSLGGATFEVVGDGPTKVASYSRQNYFNQKKAKVAGDLKDQDAAYVQRMHVQNPLKMQNAANLVMMRFEAAKLKRQESSAKDLDQDTYFKPLDPTKEKLNHKPADLERKGALHHVQQEVMELKKAGEHRSKMIPRKMGIDIWEQVEHLKEQHKENKERNELNP